MRIASPYLAAMLTAGMIVLLHFMPQEAFAQERSCEELLVEANNLYSRGAFDETIELLNQCLEQEEFTETQRKVAYRLKGLSFIGKGLEVDARETIKQLLQLVPNYEPDLVLDPPNFVEMISEVRQEIDVELETVEPETTTPKPAVLEEPTPTTVTTTSAKRKKKGNKKWILAGLGVAAAGGLVAILAGGSSDGGSGSGAISEPPPLP